MSDSVLKFLALSYVLLFTNNALCSKRKFEENSSLNHEEPHEKIVIMSSEEDSSLLEIKRILHPVINNGDFITFKNLIGETFTNSYKVHKDLLKYKSFHNEFLFKLHTLISQFSPELGNFYNSDIFYNEINYFNSLLNEKQSFENVSDDCLMVISDFFPYFEEISKLLPVMKFLFNIQNETTFDSNYEDLWVLEIKINEMKNIYDLYVHWKIENTRNYSHEKEICEAYKNLYHPLINETLANLDDEESNQRRNFKEYINKVFIDYYKCAKDISKCLSEFVETLSDFTDDCERCVSDYKDMEEIFENN